MTDAERSELEMLEGRLMRRELTEFEEERLCALRERQRAGKRFRMMLPPPFPAGAWDDGELE